MTPESQSGAQLQVLPGAVDERGLTSAEPQKLNGYKLRFSPDFWEERWSSFCHRKEEEEEEVRDLLMALLLFALLMVWSAEWNKATVLGNLHTHVKCFILSEFIHPYDLH